MKNHYLVFILMVGLIAVACSTVKYNKVYSYQDEFLNNSKKYTRVHLRPEEKRTEIGAANIIFEKEMNKDGESGNAYFVVCRASSSFKVKDKGFIKTGDRQFEVLLMNPVSEVKSKSEATISGTVLADTSGVVTGQTANIDTRTWIEDKFVINLSTEIAEAITKSSNIILRLYFGPIPITYKLEGYKLISVKNALKN
jgi:hypothetical protein